MINHIKMRSLYYLKQLTIASWLCIRPFIGPAQCRFPTGCTSYAVMQMQSQPLLTALRNIAKRLLLCSPLYHLFSCKIQHSTL